MQRQHQTKENPHAAGFGLASWRCSASRTDLQSSYRKSAKRSRQHLCALPHGARPLYQVALCLARLAVPSLAVLPVVKPLNFFLNFSGCHAASDDGQRPTTCGTGLLQVCNASFKCCHAVFSPVPPNWRPVHQSQPRGTAYLWHPAARPLVPVKARQWPRRPARRCLGQSATQRAGSRLGAVLRPSVERRHAPAATARRMRRPLEASQRRSACDLRKEGVPLCSAEDLSESTGRWSLHSAVSGFGCLHPGA